MALWFAWLLLQSFSFFHFHWYLRFCFYFKHKTFMFYFYLCLLITILLLFRTVWPIVLYSCHSVPTWNINQSARRSAPLYSSKWIWTPLHMPSRTPNKPFNSMQCNALLCNVMRSDKMWCDGALMVQGDGFYHLFYLLPLLHRVSLIGSVWWSHLLSSVRLVCCRNDKEQVVVWCECICYHFVGKNVRYAVYSIQNAYW